MSNLNQAIQLVRQGQKFEAQRILQEIIKTEPQNIQAWFWYVETCATTERRIQVLETCLNMNPGNAQVEKALQQFRNSQPPAAPMPQPPKAAMPNYSFQDVEPEPQKNDDLYGYGSFRSDAFEQPQSYVEDDKSSSYNASSYGYDSFQSNAPIKAEPDQKKPWDVDFSKYEDTSMLSKSKRAQRTYSTLDVWATAITSQDEKSYADLLQDPKMGLGRAFTWALLAGLVSALAVPLQLMFNPQLATLMDAPELQSLFRSGNSSLMVFVTLFAVIFVPISSVINLAINGVVQHFLSLLFGGGGNYTRTVYAVAAFLAPMTMITSLLVVIPLVGQCLAFPLGIYNLVLNVRALKAAHSLTNGAAIGVMFAPLILLVVFGCLFFFMSGTSFPSN